MRRASPRSRRRPPASTSLTIERMEPRQVCAVAIALAADTGTSTTDRITSDATIALSRRITPGQRVVYAVNGGPARTAVLIEGHQFVPAGLEKDGHYRIVARVVEATGRSSRPTRPLAITIDRAAAPLVVSLAQDTGVSAADAVTSSELLTVTGQERGARVQFSPDTAGFDPRTAAWGDYRPRDGANRWWVRQVDAAGNASSPVAIGFTLDTASDKAVRLAGPQGPDHTATAGDEVSWTIEFDRPMHVSAVNGVQPALAFTFRGREHFARYREGSGTNRLTYTYLFTEDDVGTGALTAPVSACLCYGGLITDAAGNRMRKHPLPPVTA